MKQINHNHIEEHIGLFDGANRYLAIAVVLLLLYYVVQVNMLAADTWRLRTSQDQLSSLRQKRDGLIAQQAQLDDRATLQSLAVGQGMVPAGAVAYVIQASSVATNR